MFCYGKRNVEGRLPNGAENSLEFLERALVDRYLPQSDMGFKGTVVVGCIQTICQGPGILGKCGYLFRELRGGQTNDMFITHTRRESIEFVDV